MKEVKTQFDDNKIETNIPDINRVDLGEVQGFFEVVDTAPTKRPKSFKDQVKYCIADDKLYFYNYKTNAWKSSPAFS